MSTVEDQVAQLDAAFEAEYRAMVEAAADGNSPDAAELRRLLRETGRGIQNFSEDVGRLQARHNAVADGKRADKLHKQRQTLERQLGKAREHFAAVQAEANRMLAEARQPLLDGERAIRENEAEERSLRQQSRKLLEQTADPAIAAEVERLLEERRTAARNANDSITQEQVDCLRSQAGKAIREAEDLADSRGQEVFCHDRREDAERLQRQADAMEARIQHAQTWAAKVPDLDRRIAQKETEIFLAERMAWTRGATVSAAAGDGNETEA